MQCLLEFQDGFMCFFSHPHHGPGCPSHRLIDRVGVHSGCFNCWLCIVLELLFEQKLEMCSSKFGTCNSKFRVLNSESCNGEGSCSAIIVCHVAVTGLVKWLCGSMLGCWL